VISVASRPGGANDRFAVGQAIQQSPAAGADAAAGDTVIVVFAAP
jgi:beta-lactam-binding protein with PASTA domain